MFLMVPLTLALNIPMENTLVFVGFVCRNLTINTYRRKPRVFLQPAFLLNNYYVCGYIIFNYSLRPSHFVYINYSKLAF